MMSKLIGLFVAGLILTGLSAPASAQLTPGCDSTIESQMTQEAQKAFDNWNKTFAGLTPQPSSTGSSKCIQQISNVFDIGSLTGGLGIANLVGKALDAFLSSFMGWLGSLFGISLSDAPTLTMASNKNLAKMAGEYFTKYLDRAVCQEAFAGVQTAFRKVSIASNGKVNLGPAAALKGIGALSKWVSKLDPTKPDDMQLIVP